MSSLGQARRFRRRVSRHLALRIDPRRRAGSQDDQVQVCCRRAAVLEHEVRLNSSSGPRQEILVVAVSVLGSFEATASQQAGKDGRERLSWNIASMDIL